MIERIAELKAEIEALDLSSAEALEGFKSAYTGRKGALTALFEAFRTLSGPEKSVVGKALNEVKQLAQARETEARERLEALRNQVQRPDLTRPERPLGMGSRHPIAAVQRRILHSFQRIGFSVAEGPEIETDWYNFEALNFEADHPARDMQDTFFVSLQPDVLLRTHTSNIQIRVMETHQPPIRISAPGRCYRNETISNRSHCYFNQVEALHVDEAISFRDLKQTLAYFIADLFGTQQKIRLRPSYFPFTEISAELDVSCLLCGGTGCSVCKHTGWVEVLGCGMVDPNVLRNCGIDPSLYSGYALGMGVERIAQLLFRVNDIRLYSQNDLRFLQQFQTYTAS
jgi:phenylalanyl-tRNA synthetase alpha chain